MYECILTFERVCGIIFIVSDYFDRCTLEVDINE